MKRDSITINENGKPEGKYANYFKIGNNELEFILDFGQYDPEKESAILYTRIVTNPVNAKEFLKTLQKAIKKHEADYGNIR